MQPKIISAKPIRSIIVLRHSEGGMEHIELSNRHHLFKFQYPEWDLYLHLIKGEHRNYLIDSGIDHIALKPLLDILASLSKPLVLINSHYHWDHVLGNYAIPADRIVAHHKTATILSDSWDALIAEGADYLQTQPPKCLPTETFFNDCWFEDDGIYLFHTPGHTVDGISVYDRIEKVLNVGDNLGDDVSHIVPELDLDVSTYIATLDQYASLEITTMVSGHMGLAQPQIIEAIKEQIASTTNT